MIIIIIVIIKSYDQCGREMFVGPSLTSGLQPFRVVEHYSRLFSRAEPVLFNVHKGRVIRGFVCVLKSEKIPLPEGVAQRSERWAEALLQVPAGGGQHNISFGQPLPHPPPSCCPSDRWDIELRLLPLGMWSGIVCVRVCVGRGLKVMCVIMKTSLASISVWSFNTCFWVLPTEQHGFWMTAEIQSLSFARDRTLLTLHRFLPRVKLLERNARSMMKSAHYCNIYITYSTLDSVYMIQCVFELTPLQPEECLKWIVHKNHNSPILMCRSLRKPHWIMELSLNSTHPSNVYPLHIW